MNPYALQGDSLRIEISEGIATLILNRPAQHNALSRELRENLTRALTMLDGDETVGVVIVTGAGEVSFCAGLDLKEVETAPLDPAEMGVDSAFMQAVAALRKPMIAAVNGTAAAGGFEIALLCDLLIASTRARFADTHCRVGIYGAWGLPQYLAMTVGPVRARYLCYTGNYLDAKTAKEWGLVLDVVEAEALLPYCRKLAKEILAVDPVTLGEVRACLRTGLLRSYEEGLEQEAVIAKDSVRRFDPAMFRAKREATLARGRAQLKS